MTLGRDGSLGMAGGRVARRLAPAALLLAAHLALAQQAPGEVFKEVGFSDDGRTFVATVSEKGQAADELRTWEVASGVAGPVEPVTASGPSKESLAALKVGADRGKQNYKSGTREATEFELGDSTIRVDLSASSDRPGAQVVIARGPCQLARELPGAGTDWNLVSVLSSRVGTSLAVVVKRAVAGARRHAVATAALDRGPLAEARCARGDEHPPLRVPSRERISDFVEQAKKLRRKGLVWREDVPKGSKAAPLQWVFWNGKAKWDVPSEGCEAMGEYTIDASAIRFECIGYGAQGSMSFELAVKHVAFQRRPDRPPVATLVFEERQGRWAATECMDISDFVTCSLISAPVLVELVAGSKDLGLSLALDTEVFKLLDRPNPPLLFRGLPARDEHAQPAIYFVGDQNEAAAKSLAQDFLPVLGPVVPTRWPGTSRFDVIVVVGASPAPVPE